MSRQLPAKKANPNQLAASRPLLKIHVRRVCQKGRVVWLAGDPADDIRGRTNDGRPMRPPKTNLGVGSVPWSALSAGILIISWWIASPIPMRGNAWFECLLVLVLVLAACSLPASGTRPVRPLLDWWLFFHASIRRGTLRPFELHVRADAGSRLPMQDEDDAMIHCGASKPVILIQLRPSWLLFLPVHFS